MLMMLNKERRVSYLRKKLSVANKAGVVVIAIIIGCYQLYFFRKSIIVIARVIICALIIIMTFADISVKQLQENVAAIDAKIIQSKAQMSTNYKFKRDSEHS